MKKRTTGLGLLAYPLRTLQLLVFGVLPLLLSACDTDGGGSRGTAGSVVHDGVSLAPLKDNLPPLILNSQYALFYPEARPKAPPTSSPFTLLHHGSNPNAVWASAYVNALQNSTVNPDTFVRTANPQPFSRVVTVSDSSHNARAASSKPKKRLITILIPTGNMPNWYQTQQLQELVSNDVGVIVVDQVMTGLSALNAFQNPRISQFYLRNNDGSWQLPPTKSDPFQHGDKVVYTIMGNSSINEHPGMFGKRGRVLFASPVRYRLGNLGHYAQLFTNDRAFAYLKVKIAQGYSIINTSWGAEIRDKKSHPSDFTIEMLLEDLSSVLGIHPQKSFQDYLKEYPSMLAMAHALAPYISDGMDEIINNNAVTRLNDLARAGANWVISAGNSSDHAGLLYLLMLSADQYAQEKGKPRQWPDLENSYVIASAFHSEGNYTNSCIIDPYHCLVAWDKVKVPLDITRDITKPWRNFYGPGYESVGQGTSFAAPYTASVIGLIKSIFPFFTPRNAQVTVLTTAYQISDGPRVNARTGWGLIQPQTAIRGPAMFYDSDFVADLSNNLSFQHENRYIFSNNISGQFGLKVKGNVKKTVLELSGKNTYRGNTTLSDNAVVDVSGVLENSTVLVQPTARLMGRGMVHALYNEGIVQSGTDSDATIGSVRDWGITVDRFNKNTLIGNQGLYVATEFQQTQSGQLWVPLGVPLVVKNKAVLQGTLNVTGIQKAIIDKDGTTAYGIAVLSGGTIINQIYEIISSNPLLIGRYANTSLLTLNPSHDLALMVRIPLRSAARAVTRGALGVVGPVEKRRLVVGARNLDNLFDSTLELDSPLSRLAQALRLDSTTKELRTSLEGLSGQEFVRTMQNNNRIDSLLISNTLFSILKPELTHNRFYLTLNQLWDWHHTETNLISAGYRFTREGYYGLVGLDYAYNHFENNAHAETNSSTQSVGIQLGVHKSYPSIDLNLQAQARVYFNTVNRQVTLADETFSQNDHYSQTDLGLRFSVSRSTTIITHQELTPYVGVGLLKQNTGAFTEPYKDFFFHSSGQTLSIFHLFAGFTYAWNEPFQLEGFHAHLDYYIQDQLNELPALRGVLRDGTVRQAIQFDTTSPLVLQTWRTRLDYQTGQLKMGANLQLVHQDHWYFSLGAQVSYDF